MDETIADKIRGVILGTAVGDSVGLPAEGISRHRNAKLFRGKWHHRFFFGRGMISDDTEHALFVAQSLIAFPNSPEQFASKLAWSFRWWVLALPAGIGFATLRASIKLWLGFSPQKSGVFSAGNGPAMRAAPVGAMFFRDPDKRYQYTRYATHITHTDPKALTGALAISEITAWMIRDNPGTKPDISDVKALLLSAGPMDNEWNGMVESLVAAAKDTLSVSEFAASMGQDKGVSGYIYHTVPVAVYAWYRWFGDYKATLEAVYDCGGDTDTVGAVAGALAGVTVGETGIPREWIDGICDWPRSVTLMRNQSDRLARCCETNKADTPAGYFRPGVVPRNLFFLVIVLLHGFRRLFPPY